jgi:hypothetical protein
MEPRAERKPTPPMREAGNRGEEQQADNGDYAIKPLESSSIPSFLFVLFQ